MGGINIGDPATLNLLVLERKNLINAIAIVSELRLNIKHNVIDIEKVLIYQN